MKIIVLAPENLSLTGGNVYEAHFYKTILEFPNNKIEYCESREYNNGFSFSKLICPLLELKLIALIKTKDVCFWNSTAAYRHFILLMIVRLFYPKIKVYIFHHHYQYEMMQGVKKEVFKFFEVNFLRLATSIIIPSPYVLKETRKLLPTKKVNYVEIAFDNNISLQGTSPKSGQLLYVGTVESRKGLHLLIEILSLLKSRNNNFTMNIIGGIVNEGYHKELLEKVSFYGLEKHVFFLGRLPSKELKKYFLQSDLFIFPSLLEGFGMVIIEAMSFGIPVIAFDNTAMPFTIKHNFNGLLVKNKDLLDFKNKIELVLNDSDLREKLSIGAIETFNKSRRTSEFKSDIEDFIKEMA